MAERSTAEASASLLLDVPEMLKSISSRFANLWAECRKSPERDGPGTTEDTPVVSQEGEIDEDSDQLKDSLEQIPLTKDQRVVVALLQCGYSKYLYLPKERAISTHGWLG